MRPELTELSVAAVVLLDQHGRPSTLLELLLLVVTPELTLDKDGSLCHLLIKCILPQSREIIQSGWRTGRIFSHRLFSEENECWCLVFTQIEELPSMLSMLAWERTENWPVIRYRWT